MNRQIWQNRARTLQTCSPIQTDHYDTEYVEAKERDELRAEVERLKKQVGDSRLYAQDLSEKLKAEEADLNQMEERFNVGFKNFALERECNKVLREALEKAEKRFSHIENWHRDFVTPENFKDCQEIGLTPEQYLRDGKIEAREALAKEKAVRGE